MTTWEEGSSPDVPPILVESLFPSGSKAEATLIQFLETQTSFTKWLMEVATTFLDTSRSGTTMTTMEIWRTLLDLAFQSPTMASQMLIPMALEGSMESGPMDRLYVLMKEALYACELG